MKDQNKTKAQLIDELELLKKKISALESGEGLPEQEKEGSGKSGKWVKHNRDSFIFAEDGASKLELADIINIQEIQSLMNDFYHLAHIPMSIIDLKDRVLVGMGFWQDICTKFHRIHPETCRYCIESDTKFTEDVPAGEYKLYKCKNNMWDAATPIMIGDTKMGNIFVGQFFFDDEQLDYELFRSQARQYGFPEEEYIAALEAVPRLSRESLENAMAFFAKLAQMISRLSYVNIKLAQSLVERDELMTSLQEAEEKYRGIYEDAAEGIFRTTLDGRILEANPAFARILGYDSPEELKKIVKNIDQCYADPAKRQEWLQEVAERDYSRFEMQFRRKDGSIGWVSNKIRIIRNMKGEIIYFDGFSEDITERKQAEIKLKEHALKLEAANQELESFSYSISHDLRAPLRVINQHSWMILRKQGDKFDAVTKRRFDMIRENTRMMGELIEGLLAFTRLGKKKLTMSRLNVNDLAKAVWEELKTANRDRAIDLKINPLPPGTGDRLLIREVLVNILSNAIKFTRDRVGAVIEVGGCVEKTENVYYVRDNGVGFDTRYQDKLFGVFQRLHSIDDFEGIGIGLAIVQRIVNLHGGRLWAESGVDKGAIFYFTLPTSKTN